MEPIRGLDSWLAAPYETDDTLDSCPGCGSTAEPVIYDGPDAECPNCGRAIGGTYDAYDAADDRFDREREDPPEPFDC